ncbi:MAG: hypothetical protein RBQ71_00665 [Acholeplasmataceae bacterium]|jgi:uncharacterized membrane protein (DUF485 family)|nr:hypothetical protein [Acholeplasmataceae bacterium]
MNNNEKDPFEQFDHLFDEQDKNSIVQPSTQKKEHKQSQPNQPKPLTNEQKTKAVRIIITVAFAVLFIQFIPVILFSDNRMGSSVLPVFSFIFTVVIINIIIKAFKR